MAPVGTLWGWLRQPLTKFILSVAVLNDLELEQREWNFLNKPAEFTVAFPYGKIPAFEGLDGFKLSEGVAIARYLNGLGKKVNLLGSNPKEIALIDQWIHFSEQEIGAPVHQIMGMIYGYGGPFSLEALDVQLGRLARALKHVEAYLATSTSGYLVSDSVTLADFVLASMVHGASYSALGAAERAQYPAVLTHYAKVTEEERVKHLWGSQDFTEVAVREQKPVPTKID